MILNEADKDLIEGHYKGAFLQFIHVALQRVKMIALGVCVPSQKQNERDYIRFVTLEGREAKLSMLEAKKSGLLIVNLFSQDEELLLSKKVFTISAETLLRMIHSDELSEVNLAMTVKREWEMGLEDIIKHRDEIPQKYPRNMWKNAGKFLRAWWRECMKQGLMYDFFLEVYMTPLYHVMYGQEYPFSHELLMKEIKRIDQEYSQNLSILTKHYQFSLNELKSVKVEDIPDLKCQELIKNYRKLKKKKSQLNTQKWSGNNGKESSFTTIIKPIGTATFRCMTNSGTNGINLYGLPKKVRGMLRPRKGEIILTLDISACHPMILSYAAGEKELQKTYEEGRDIYKEMAAGFFCVSTQEVTDTQRSCMKVVFLILLNAEGSKADAAIYYTLLEKGVSTSFAKCSEMRENFFVKYHHIAAFLMELRCGDTMTLPGGRTWSKNKCPERKSRPSYYLQQIEAECLKRSCYVISKRIEKISRTALYYTLHDSISLETTYQEKEWVKGLVESVVTSVFQEYFPTIKKVILKEE